jgi:hypothetical protein
MLLKCFHRCALLVDGLNINYAGGGKIVALGEIYEIMPGARGLNTGKTAFTRMNKNERFFEFENFFRCAFEGV